MMQKTFQELVNQLIQERGVGILENTGACKALLQDYAKGRFKREIRLFLQSIGAGHHQKLLKTAEPEQTRHWLVRSLQDEYGIDREIAEKTIFSLEAGLFSLETGLKTPAKAEEQGYTHLRKQAEAGNYHAQYALGAVLSNLKQYEEAAAWFEKAARRCMTLYEASVLAPSPAALNLPPETGFAEIAAGTFLMGSPETESGRGTDELQHPVTVESFCMGEYAVTQEAYTAVTGTNPSAFQGPDLPVERVSWFDAVSYCNRLSAAGGLTPAYRIQEEQVTWNRDAEGYRLPTEAEWEYACRAGTFSPFSFGQQITYLEANYKASIYRRRTTAAGSFPPNPWGLYDMHGNIGEWCWDWYWDYDPRQRRNPVGAPWGTRRVVRGGNWKADAPGLRSACRSSSPPGERSDCIGFRILCSPVCTQGGLV